MSELKIFLRVLEVLSAFRQQKGQKKTLVPLNVLYISMRILSLTSTQCLQSPLQNK